MKPTKQLCPRQIPNTHRNSPIRHRRSFVTSRRAFGVAALLAMLAIFLPNNYAEPLKGVDELLADPAVSDGQTLALEAFVDRVSAQRRMVILIDVSEADCQDACNRKTLAALFPETVPLPEKGTKVTLQGVLRASQDPQVFEVQSLAP